MSQPVDLRTLCHALAFMAVVVHAPRSIRRPGEATRRALGIAAQIEEFCLSYASGGQPAAAENPSPRNGESQIALITRMAHAIADVIRDKDGSCRPDDLIGTGFTREDIERCWLTAQALAHVILNQPPPPADA